MRLTGYKIWSDWSYMIKHLHNILVSNKNIFLSFLPVSPYFPHLHVTNFDSTAGLSLVLTAIINSVSDD